MLSIQDYHILDFLSEDCGALTRDVALKAGGGAGRRQRAWTRHRLLSLQIAGLVAELDDQKPVCWKRTAVGSDVLARGKELGYYRPAAL